MDGEFHIYGKPVYIRHALSVDRLFVFRRWLTESLWCTGTKTSASVPTELSAPSIHSASRQVVCPSTPRGTSYWHAWLTLTRTEVRSSSHRQVADRSSCWWHRPTSAMTFDRSTSGRSTSTVTKGSRSLRERGTIRPISNRRRTPTAKGRGGWYFGTSRARSSRVSGWTVSRSSESSWSSRLHLTAERTNRVRAIHVVNYTPRRAAIFIVYTVSK